MTEQQILDNAPEGWTHIDAEGCYWKFADFEVHFWSKEKQIWDYPSWSLYDEFFRSRKDIERIVELEKERDERVLNAAAAGFAYGLELPIPPKQEGASYSAIDLRRKNIHDAAKGYAYQYLDQLRKQAGG